MRSDVVRVMVELELMDDTVEAIGHERYYEAPLAETLVDGVDDYSVLGICTTIPEMVPEGTYERDEFERGVESAAERVAWFDEPIDADGVLRVVARIDDTPHDEPVYFTRRVGTFKEGVPLTIIGACVTNRYQRVQLPVTLSRSDIDEALADNDDVRAVRWLDDAVEGAIA